MPPGGRHDSFAPTERIEALDIVILVIDVIAGLTKVVTVTTARAILLEPVAVKYGSASSSFEEAIAVSILAFAAGGAIDELALPDQIFIKILS